MDSHQTKRDPNRNFASVTYLPSSFLQIDSLEDFVSNYRQKSAIKIQKCWRGYHCRKKFKENKNHLRQLKAVIILQRSIREWLHRRKNNDFPATKYNIYCLEKIEESRIPILQDEIRQWNKANDANFETPEKLQLQLETVQKQLKCFYEKAATRKNRMERCYSLCTQIDAIASLLIDLPSVEQCDQADISVFQTPIVSYNKLAKLRHKQELKACTAPWWKRLQRDSNMN